MAIGGLIFFVVGSLKHSELDFGKGMLLLTVGFLIAWVGKIGLFWVR